MATLQTNNGGTWATAADATSNVVFKVDRTPVFTNNLSGRTVPFISSTLTSAAHTITAEYRGDAKYTAGTIHGVTIICA